MARNASIVDGAQSMLRDIPEAFRLFPLPDVASPRDPSQWADFLREYPQYVDNGHYKIPAVTLAEDRTILEGMSEDYQRLGGSLIRAVLTDEDLLRIHEQGTYWG